MRVIVSGTRHATREDHGREIARVLRTFLRHAADGELVHGAAGGVDKIATTVAAGWGWRVTATPARWDECDESLPMELGGCPPRPHRRRRYPHGGEYCPFAGPRRNQLLVHAVPRADMVVAFPAANTPSTGTADLIRRARQVELLVVTHPLHIPRFMSRKRSTA